eukprot:gene23191-34497_t
MLKHESSDGRALKYGHHPHNTASLRPVLRLGAHHGGAAAAPKFKKRPASPPTFKHPAKQLHLYPHLTAATVSQTSTGRIPPLPPYQNDGGMSPFSFDGADEEAGSPERNYARLQHSRSSSTTPSFEYLSGSEDDSPASLNEEREKKRKKKRRARSKGAAGGDDDDGHGGCFGITGHHRRHHRKPRGGSADTLPCLLGLLGLVLIGLGFATTAPALYSPSIAPASANAASDAKYNYNNNINTVDSLDVNNLGADDNSVTSSSSSGIVSIARLAHHRLAAAEGAGDATGVDISVVGVGGGGGGGGKQKTFEVVRLKGCFDGLLEG